MLVRAGVDSIERGEARLGGEHQAQHGRGGWVGGGSSRLVTGLSRWSLTNVGDVQLGGGMGGARHFGLRFVERALRRGEVGTKG